MITFVTVWVLTLTSTPYSNNRVETQFTYATQEICVKQGKTLREKYDQYYTQYYCNFQQVPTYVPKEK